MSELLLPKHLTYTVLPYNTVNTYLYMTTKDLVNRTAATTAFNKEQTASLVEIATQAIVEELLNGNNVQIQKFGTFEVRKKNERVTVNPRTNVRTLTPPKLQINFKQHTALKETLKDN